MAIAGAKVTVTQAIKWTPSSGDSLNFSGAESFVQVGLQAKMETMNAASTTAAIPLGAVTGDKYFGVKNTDPNITVYVDSVTPVVPTAVSAKKLPPGKALAIFTHIDTWYVIADSGTPEIVYAAVQP